MAQSKSHDHRDPPCNLPPGTHVPYPMYHEKPGRVAVSSVPGVICVCQRQFKASVRSPSDLCMILDLLGMSSIAEFQISAWKWNTDVTKGEWKEKREKREQVKHKKQNKNQ